MLKAGNYVYICSSFEKSTIKHYLDYCYGIESSLDNLSLYSIIDLLFFIARITKGTIGKVHEVYAVINRCFQYTNKKVTGNLEANPISWKVNYCAISGRISILGNLTRPQSFTFQRSLWTQDSARFFYNCTSRHFFFQIN